MPELPEVEVLRRSLEVQLEGDLVRHLEVREPSLREPVDVPNLRRAVTGRRIVAFRRRAKYLLLDLDAGWTLVVHLGMSGRLTVAAGDSPPRKHDHLWLELASGRRLRFEDARRFGLVFALPTDRLQTDRHFLHLGLEPLDGEFSASRLRQAAGSRRAPVKNLLMNARIVVGVGNIYATEALFRAAIHPRRSATRIGAARWSRLAGAVVEVLEDAIAQGGTTLSDFTDGNGQSGYFQIALAAYGREGEACPRCGGRIRRIVQAGRSTFYCPRCQR